MRKTIRELRTERSWSQADLAHKANVAPSSIYNWESGRYEPRASQMRSLADAFGVLMDDIELIEPKKVLAAA